MAEEVFSFIVGACIAAIIFYFVGGYLSAKYTTEFFKVEIIERGYGEYCPKTGEFAFIGECDEASSNLR
jgi:hypothetical protein